MLDVTDNPLGDVLAERSRKINVNGRRRDLILEAFAARPPGKLILPFYQPGRLEKAESVTLQFPGALQLPRASFFAPVGTVSDLARSQNPEIRSQKPQPPKPR